MAFDDILAQIAEETDRETLRGLAVKYPNVQGLVETGERFTALRNELVALQINDPDEALTMAPKMFDWARRNFDYEAGMTHSEKLARETADTLRTEIEELRAKGEGEMTVDQMESALKAKGVVFKDDLKDVATRGDVTAAAGVLTQQFESVYSATLPLATEHAQKFGESIPIGDVIKVMNEQGIKDPRVAYEKVVAPKQAALDKVATEKAIADAEKRGEQKGRETAAQELAGRGASPIDGSGPSRGTSRYMQQVLERRAKAGNGNDRLGQGSIAQKAAAEHHQKVISQGAA